MRKISTLFVRDPDHRARVINEVSPGCEWVLAGEGRATRKYDGTCVLVERDPEFGAIIGWARREVKPGKQPPPNFRQEDYDKTTGKTMGWEPIDQSSFPQFFWEAAEFHREAGAALVPGTYELCGPKVNGNPEGLDRHLLIPHGKLVMDYAPRDFDGLKAFLTDPEFEGEGIVWWHDDGRKAKLKRKDFA